MSKGIIYFGGTKFTKFYLRNLFTNELGEVTEKDFNDVVTNFRGLYELHYETPNRQLFELDGVIEGARERGLTAKEILK